MRITKRLAQVHYNIQLDEEEMYALVEFFKLIGDNEVNEKAAQIQGVSSEDLNQILDDFIDGS